MGGGTSRCLLTVPLVWVMACLVACTAQFPVPVSGPSSAALPAAPPTSEPTPTKILAQESADLDGDGNVELVTALPMSGGVRLTVETQARTAWAWDLEGLGEPLRLDIVDVNGDNHPDIVLDGAGRDAATFLLALVSWTAGEGRLLVADCPPIAASGCARSLHYPAVLRDLDGDGLHEVIVWATGGEPGLLDTVVLRWGGDTYLKTKLFLMPPRPLPSPTPG